MHICVDNAQRLNAPGMSVRVRQLANRSDAALVLPMDVIVCDASDGMSVWRVVVEDGVTLGMKVVVQTGRETT